MHKRTRVAIAATAAAALTSGLLALTAIPAAATGSGDKADFNGDGYADVAFSAGNAYVSGLKGAGQVVALYGSSNGLTAARRSVVSQNTSGVPGSAEKGDGFGWITAIGDFNSDGFSDLAVSAASEDLGSDVDGGMVTILWGSTKGLTGGTTLADPAPSSHDRWGRSLAAADFDGDGKDDLAVGSSASTVYVYKGGITKSGTSGGRYTVKPPIQSGGATGPLNLTAGEVNGDGRTDLIVDGYETTGDYGWNANYYIPGSASGLVASRAVKLQGGVITGIGDVNGDSFGDIVIGVSWDPGTSGEPSVPGSVKGGKVKVVYGTPTGPGTSTSITQESGNIPGGSEKGDAFGNELHLGDINGDGFQDLAIGSAGEDLNGVVDAGSVTLLYGSPAGLNTTSGYQYFTQNTAGVPGSDEKSDQFGGELHLDDVNGDGKADLTVTTYGENGGNGAVTALRSDGTAISTGGALSIAPSTVGVSTSGNPLFGANFGN
ncbi:VCBS repeat-containing protein [Actinacidiphila glaucinigra]|uniref:FG-GAP and VCBS repeat-containing protein n=1 Tax=Actinacidiphila glaucinigra TaxID=235986 RepID=UPI002DD93B84|nr:FG-GAP and VCBS repeat-containing protein [Actinacidiphila glaucinigra]WSD61314.1 VCBS repeat-containing protein [Actinacidiphila glaucinigra]